MNEKAIKLLDYLGLDHDTEVKDATYSDDVYIVDGEEYLVLTDKEADIRHEEYIELFLDDCGIEGFTEFGQEYIIENCMGTDWFDEAMRDSYECYAEDIKEEPASSEEFDNRLEEEMAESNCDDEDSFVDSLCSQYDNGVEWYRSNFGDKDFFSIAKERCSVDISKVSEFCIEQDGRGHCLASYDGCELELDNNYYAYRLN